MPYEGENLWHEVEWDGQNLDVLMVSWQTDMGNSGSRHFVLADTKELAEAFVNAVCIWNTELREEVLVFEGGWHKDDQSLVCSL